MSDYTEVLAQHRARIDELLAERVELLDRFLVAMDVLLGAPPSPPRRRRNHLRLVVDAD